LQRAAAFRLEFFSIFLKKSPNETLDEPCATINMVVRDYSVSLTRTSISVVMGREEKVEMTQVISIVYFVMGIDYLILAIIH
jgi:hypothetical protein